MNDAEITNFYSEGSDSPKNIVIFLHGLGSNGQDLIALAGVMGHIMPDTVFVSPDAPFDCDMAPPGYPNSYQWFSLQDRDPAVMEKGVENAAPILEAFIKEQLEKYGLDYGDLALCGFSQGTMMSLYKGTRLPKPIAGILGYSGAQLGEPGPNKTPVCLIHGEADDVVPVEAFFHARQELDKAGFTVTGHTTPGLTHSIDERGLREGSLFLKSVLYAETPSG
ncbi:MAG: phospholipase [Alphaproteobacteria bacterium]|nr:phospholipase [Alphaproteobacteria bacterium]